MDSPAPASWIARYLRFLGQERSRPSRAALRRLVRAQVESFVFENITAILRRARAGDGPVPSPDPGELLDAAIDGRGGGVCFDLAPMFRRLLRGLEYEVTPLLAQISFPGSHHATLVAIDGDRFLVDVGGGWPLWEPIPLGEVVEFGHVGLGFRFRPGEDGMHVQERRADGDWTVACRYDLRPASAAAREAAYQRHQIAGETWVVGSLTLVRSTADAIHRVRDEEFVSYTADGKRVHELTEGDFGRLARDVFALPFLAVDEARLALAAIRRPQTRARPGSVSDPPAAASGLSVRGDGS